MGATLVVSSAPALPVAEVHPKRRDADYNQQDDFRSAIHESPFRSAGLALSGEVKHPAGFPLERRATLRFSESVRHHLHRRPDVTIFQVDFAQRRG